jgi:hypothetical protein
LLLLVLLSDNFQEGMANMEYHAPSIRSTETHNLKIVYLKTEP